MRNVSITNIISSVVSLAMLSCSAVAAQSDAPDTKSSSGTPLQAGVELDEKLPGLAGQYDVGSKFDEAEFQSLNPDNLWFPIPKWLAGKWHTDQKLLLFIQDCKTGKVQDLNQSVKESSDVVHGHQKDKTGQIWEYIKIPRTQVWVLSHAKAYVKALKEEVIASNDDQVVLKILDNQITVDDKKKTITRTDQVEQLGKYGELEDGLVKMDATAKNFDGAGDPISIQKLESLMKRTAPFENIDSQDGQDLKKLFVEFLKKTRRENLIPD